MDTTNNFQRNSIVVKEPRYQLSDNLHEFLSEIINSFKTYPKVITERNAVARIDRIVSRKTVSVTETTIFQLIDNYILDSGKLKFLKLAAKFIDCKEDWYEIVEDKINEVLENLEMLVNVFGKSIIPTEDKIKLDKLQDVAKSAASNLMNALK